MGEEIVGPGGSFDNGSSTNVQVGKIGGVVAVGSGAAVTVGTGVGVGIGLSVGRGAAGGATVDGISEMGAEVVVFGGSNEMQATETSINRVAQRMARRALAITFFRIMGLLLAL